ncbi:MAG: GNAT family N-acetyltransferase [Caldilineaceae bacterium]
MITIMKIMASEVKELGGQLVALLQNTVDNGASVGFIAPLSTLEAQEYWQGVMAAVEEGHKILLIATEDGRVAGAVQLALEPRANGNHRAEVQKLMVHTGFRRRGIGRLLMEALHEEARRAQRTLIVLDTRTGDDAGRLYERMGYRLAGIIPRYARSSAGILTDTAYYYLEL